MYDFRILNVITVTTKKIGTEYAEKEIRKEGKHFITKMNWTQYKMAMQEIGGGSLINHIEKKTGKWQR